MKKETGIWQTIATSISLLTVLFGATYACQESSTQEFTARDTEHLDQLLCEQKWTEEEIRHALCNAYCRAVEKLLQRKSSEKGPVPCNHKQTIEHLRDSGFYLERQRKEGGAAQLIYIQKEVMDVLDLLRQKVRCYKDPKPDIFPDLTNDCICSPINLAVVCNNYELVGKLLQAGTPINEKEGADFTPLTYATEQGHLAILELLIANGARIDRRYGYYRNSLLHLAAKHGHLDIVKILLAQGLQIDQKNNDGQTALFSAVAGGHLNCLELLIAQGAHTDMIDKSGNSLLHVAAALDHTEIVKLLLEQGLSVDQRNSYGQTPLFFAVNQWARNPETPLPMFNLLKNTGANIHSKDNNGCSLLHEATQSGDRNIEMVKALLRLGLDPNHTDNTGYPPLFTAAKYGGLQIVKLLLSAGARIDTVSDDSYTVLHAACSAPFTCKVLAFLLARKVPISLNHQTKEGETPLHIAARDVALDHMKLLINAGARLDIPGNRGNSLLHTILEIYDCDSSASIEYLLDEGAEINNANNQGKRPLDIALLNYETLAPAAVLLRRGADYGPGHIQQIVAHDDFKNVIWNLLPHIFSHSQAKQFYWHSAVLTSAVKKNLHNFHNWTESREGRACMLIQLLPSIDLRQFSNLEDLKAVLLQFLPEDLVNEFCALEGLPLRKSDRPASHEDKSIQVNMHQSDDSQKGIKRDREESKDNKSTEHSTKRQKQK